MSNDLFREEALAHRRRRMDGEIILTRSLPLWTVAALLAIIVLALAAWLLFGEYRRVETVRGEVIPQGLVGKVFASRPGIVVDLTVRDGDRVEKGQALATVEVEQALSGGQSPFTERARSLSQEAQLRGSEIGLEVRRAAAERMRLASELNVLVRQEAALRHAMELQ